MTRIRRLTASPHLLALAGIVVVGAILRFATIDLQSYRYDEAVTVARVIRPGFFETLSTVPHSESTPPLYYALAWLWSRPFGTGELWLRSLSALAGTGSIVVVYLAAVALPLRRLTGLVAAAIVAVSPVLIWFSQDARAYALVFLLTSLSFLFFARARRGWERRDLVLWAVFSALAIATHYFAGFVVVLEAGLLLWWGPRRQVAIAVGAVAVVGALLLPIAIEQANNAHAGWIAEQPIGERLERATAKLVGNDNGDEHGARQPGPIPLGVPIALAVAALALLLARGDPEERRSAGLAAAIGGGAVALSLLLALLGKDYFDGRNLIPTFGPLIVVIAAGFTVRRAGRLGVGLATAFCACSLIFTLEIDRLPRLQREDLRNAAAVVGPLRPDKAVVTIRHAAGWPLAYYLGAEIAKGALPPLREIDLVGSASAERDAARLLPPAFHRVGSQPVSYNFTLTRFRASHPVRVSLHRLENGALVGGGGRASVLVLPPPPAS
ncbi:MAG: glycosyltransferase family 39 protein [Actinobacteria bacterium]|nr:glycosyltransferase family 39 protein [Actinomycetota bacterium]